MARWHMSGLLLWSVDYQVLRMTARFFSLLWIRLRDRLRKRRLEEGIERRHKRRSISANSRWIRYSTPRPVLQASKEPTRRQIGGDNVRSSVYPARLECNPLGLAARFDSG